MNTDLTSIFGEDHVTYRCLLKSVYVQESSNSYKKECWSPSKFERKLNESILCTSGGNVDKKTHEGEEELLVKTIWNDSLRLESNILDERILKIAEIANNVDGELGREE